MQPHMVVNKDREHTACVLSRAPSLLTLSILCLFLSACANLPNKEEEQLLARYQGQLHYTSITLQEIPDYKATIESELSESTKGLQSVRTAQAAVTMPFCAAVTSFGTVVPIAYIPGLFCLGSMSKEAVDAAHMDSPEGRKKAEQELKNNYSDLIDRLNADMFAAVLDYGKSSGIQHIYLHSPPEGAESTSNWSISIGLKSLKFNARNPEKSDDYSLVFIVHATLRAPSGKEVDAMDYEYTSSYAPLPIWFADNNQHISKVSRLAYANIAEHVIDEFVLIWHPVKPRQKDAVNSADTKDHMSRVPYYVVRPTYQIEYPILFTSEPYGLGLQALHPVNSRTPVFSWLPFPQPELGPKPDEIKDVTYEFRIYDKLPAGKLVFFKDELFFEQKGITGTSFKLPRKLETCAIYSWTVRARFMYKDFPRVTEWAGAYNAPQPATKPWVSRRNYQSLHGAFSRFNDPKEFYFLIKTPHAPWEDRCTTYY